MGIGVLGWAVVGFARIGYDFFADDDAVHSVTAASATFGLHVPANGLTEPSGSRYP